MRGRRVSACQACLSSRSYCRIRSHRTCSRFESLGGFMRGRAARMRRPHVRERRGLALARPGLGRRRRTRTGTAQGKEGSTCQTEMGRRTDS